MIYKFRKIIIFIIVLLFIFVSLFFLKDFNKISYGNSYYAFFLSTGQIYFGKLVDQNNLEFKLENVFYLQSNSSSEMGQFNLIKISDEIHGPKDLIVIQRQSVVFYEILRDDSKLVESIKKR